MTFPPIIKYTGSKRRFFQLNHKLIPTSKRYIDPFIGGGSSLPYFPNNVLANDISSDLIQLWDLIKCTPPNDLSKAYEHQWNQLRDLGKSYYYTVRQEFNVTRNPLLFLFLTRTSRNGLIRFNSKGEFNAAYHIGRDGIHPDNFNKICHIWHDIVQKVDFSNKDYREVTQDADEETFIFFDPPYYSRKASACYRHGLFDFTSFFDELRRLNQKGVKWIFTFDGDEIGVVPKDVYKYIQNIKAESLLKKVAGKEFIGNFSNYYNYDFSASDMNLYGLVKNE